MNCVKKRKKKDRRWNDIKAGGVLLLLAAFMAAAWGVHEVSGIAAPENKEERPILSQVEITETAEREQPLTVSGTDKEPSSQKPSESAVSSEAVSAPPVQIKPADDFSDAVFIGDSRTEGLMIYTGLHTATFYTATGLMVNTAQTKPVIGLENGAKGTVLDALRQHSFGRVYIMLGINELGWPYGEQFKGEYTKLIRAVKEIQPQAQIYIQSILPVSQKKSEGDSIYNNMNVRKFNGWIQEVAAQENATFLNVSEAVQDAQGNLPEGASSDGIHLTKEYCRIWLEYLREKAQGN